MVDTAFKLSRKAWIDSMESVAGSHKNPIVGICRNCKEKIYKHQVLLEAATPDYCNEDCQAEFMDSHQTVLEIEKAL